MLYIASDHGGYNLKQQLKQYFRDQGIESEDLGPESLNLEDDYPDYAAKVAEKVSADPNESAGILLCRSGQGVNITANKFKGIRAALVWNEKEAVASKTDDLANILSLPSDYVSVEDAKKIAGIWLKTPLGNEARHVRRVGKINSIEENLYK